MAVSTGRPAPDRLADARVKDRDGDTSRLGERWASGPALLVFLRHFGCVACSEHVTLLMPRLAELRALGVGVTFVGSGDPQYVEGFVERNGIVPDLADVVTDPSLQAHSAAGMVRGRWQTFGPRAIRNFVRAVLAGNEHGSPQGDSLQQGGVILVAGDGTVEFAHADAALGDHAVTNDVVQAVMRLAATGAAVA